MRHALWHSWSRMSGALFPVSVCALFFTPQGSGYGLMLAAAALASGFTWIYLRDRHE